MKIVGCSDIGLSRKENQDSFSFGTLDSGKAFWLVVCDGMGGENGGSTASNIAVSTISEQIGRCYNSKMTTSSIQNLLYSAILAANVNIYEKSLTDASLSGMGTTIVMAFIKDNTVTVAHVGDSRAYCINRGQMKQLTKDHSFVYELYEKGAITYEEMRTHPQRNMITRALGSPEETKIDFSTFTLDADDKILICSDGLTSMLTDDEIRDIIENTEMKSVCARLIDGANEKGGKDNITVAIFYANEEGVK